MGAQRHGRGTSPLQKTNTEPGTYNYVMLYPNKLYHKNLKYGNRLHTAPVKDNDDWRNHREEIMSQREKEPKNIARYTLAGLGFSL